MNLIGYFTKKSHQNELSELLNSLKKLRNESDFVLLSPLATGYSWLGVYNGGASMFPRNIVGLPHYYSNSLFSEFELEVLSREIAQLNFKQVLLNGFAPYFEKLVRDIKANSPDLPVGVVYHGFPAELSGNKTMQDAMNGLIRLCKDKHIRKIGFAKKWFGQAFEGLFGTPAYELIYINPEPIRGISKFADGKIHIGILVNNLFRKNFHTQVMAGLLINGSVLHVTDASELAYLDAGDRIIAHGHLNHEQFIRLLASMDVNLHVTFSEASGGQVCSESVSQGVPCVSGYTSAFFDYNEQLKNKLIVAGYDDPYHIASKITTVLAQKEVLSKQCSEYAAYMNTLAHERIGIFLAA